MLLELGDEFLEVLDGDAACRTTAACAVGCRPGASITTPADGLPRFARFVSTLGTRSCGTPIAAASMCSSCAALGFQPPCLASVSVARSSKSRTESFFDDGADSTDSPGLAG